MIEIVKKFLTREESASGFVNGAYIAGLAFAGAALGAAVFGWQAALLAGGGAAIGALGGRVAEGARKGVTNDAEAEGP